MLEKKLSLPPQELRFMNEDDEKFLKIGKENLNILREYGFNASHYIIDVGCGYGRLAYAIINNINFQGKYIGVDILPKHLSWCANHITAHYPNIQFDLLNVRNDRYFPTGKINPEEYKFQFKQNYFDFCSLFSLFTHMYEEDIKNYLHEIFKITKIEGIVIATFFLLKESRMTKVVEGDKGLTMHYKLNDYTRYYNQDDKLHAISFDENFIFSLTKNAGFEILNCLYGHWAGGEGLFYQDTLILKKKPILQ